MAGALIETHCYRLPQVHRDMFLVGGDRQQPMAVGEVIVRQADLFRSEQQGNASDLEMPANHSCGIVSKLAQRMLQDAVAYCASTDHLRTVGDRLRNRREFFGTF